jgi:methionine-gamma-lyase
MSEQDREDAGISEGLLRLSVGLEDPEDLWKDLDNALQKSSSRSLLVA